MNRIAELKKLATEVEHSHGAFGEHERYYRLNPDKFAESIIKETLQVVAKNISWNGYLNASDAVLKHFEIRV